MTFGTTPWPCTLSLARVHVAPNQKLCSITYAMELAKERFHLDSSMESPHYYLTPISTEAPYILSDAGLQHKPDVTTVIGVAAMHVNPADNTVDLATSKGPTSTLMVCRLLHLEDSLVLIPPQLSCSMWTGMRQATIQYESFIHFTTSYAPPGKLDVEVTAHQLGFIWNLIVPEPAVLLSLADQLEDLKAVPTEPSEAITEPHQEEGTKEETPKKAKSAEADPPRKHHRSREEKGWSRHSPTEKSPASLTREHNVILETDKLGDVVLTLTIDLPPERECRITLGDASQNVSAGQNIVSALPSLPLTGGGSARTVAGKSTIRFGQAMIQPITFMQPALDYPFFKKPASTPISTPQKSWGAPDARSSPLLRESRMSPEDTPDLTKSSAEPLVIIKDVVSNEDEAPAPDKLGSSNMKSAHESSKQ